MKVGHEKFFKKTPLDSGRPRTTQRGQHKGGHQSIIQTKFLENCMEMKKIEGGEKKGETRLKFIYVDLLLRSYKTNSYSWLLLDAGYDLLALLATT